MGSKNFFYRQIFLPVYTPSIGQEYTVTCLMPTLAVGVKKGVGISTHYCVHYSICKVRAPFEDWCIRLQVRKHVEVYAFRCYILLPYTPPNTITGL